jgi:N-acetylglucosamine-6-phosphate deacetylase
VRVSECPLTRFLFTGANLVLPDRVATGETLVVEGERIVDVVSGLRLTAGDREVRYSRDGLFILPGFVDVHVHGAVGIDVLDGAGAVAALAARLPRWGVTAFCPTSIACDPPTLAQLLQSVAELRYAPPSGARVLPAHLESNFINPDFRGAQPLGCLRRFRAAGDAGRESGMAEGESFTAEDVLAVVDRHRPDVGLFTLAPELDGGLDLVRRLVSQGIRPSLGHSGATFEQASEAIAAGAAHATHLFNRMTAMTHRAPGLTGAVLVHDEVATEIVCDGHHVHPAMIRIAVAAKTPARVMAITDGTAGSGLPLGTRTRLGGQAITVAEVARLDDGTMAGSVLTMDQAFACLVTQCGLDLVQAASMCATTPAREMGMHGYGILAPGAMADFVILDQGLKVVETWVGGVRLFGHSEVMGDP